MGGSVPTERKRGSMTMATGFRSAEVQMGRDGKFECVVRFDTREQAAKFQNIAYAISGYADGSERKPFVTVGTTAPSEDDQFMKGIARNAQEAGFSRSGRGDGRPPSEKQEKLAKIIAKKLIVALPTEKTSRAYYEFIKRYKPDLDAQIEAENKGKGRFN